MIPLFDLEAIRSKRKALSIAKYLRKLRATSDSLYRTNISNVRRGANTDWYGLVMSDFDDFTSIFPDEIQRAASLAVEVENQFQSNLKKIASLPIRRRITNLNKWLKDGKWNYMPGLSDDERSVFSKYIFLFKSRSGEKIGFWLDIQIEENEL